MLLNKTKYIDLIYLFFLVAPGLLALVASYMFLNEIGVAFGFILVLLLVIIVLFCIYVMQTVDSWLLHVDNITLKFSDDVFAGARENSFSRDLSWHLCQLDVEFGPAFSQVLLSREFWTLRDLTVTLNEGFLKWVSRPASLYDLENFVKRVLAEELFEGSPIKRTLVISYLVFTLKSKLK